VGNGGILRDIRTAAPTRPEDEGVVFRRSSLNEKVVDSWYTPELLPKSLNTTGMQDACTIDKLKQEIQRLQKTLSDKEDLVLATRRIAADKERKLKGELVEVTEKYGEVCQEKVSLEDEIILLKDSSVNKDEHNKLFTLYTKTEALVFELQSKLVNCAATVPLEEYRMLQRELEESTDEVLQYKDIAARKEKELEAVILSQSDRIQALKEEHAKQLAEGHKMTKKEVTDRDEKLKLLKEQITSALDEKSIARQEQLKELSRELEHTAQENRMLHKKIQELSHKIQNCENCAKLKSQLKLIQDSNGKRLVDVNILKPIKEKGKMK